MKKVLMIAMVLMISPCLAFAIICPGFSPSSATAVAQTGLIAPETIDTETQALGLPNRLMINDFNIWLNPSQIVQYGTVYGEIWNATGSNWGGATVKLPLGKLGIFAGRPYSGNVALTGTTPLVAGFNGNGISSMVGPGVTVLGIQGDPLIYNVNALGIAGNQIDVMYGFEPIDLMSVGLRISLAENSEEKTYSYSNTPSPAAKEGSISNSQKSSDMQISLGALMKNIGPLETIDAALGIATPKISNEYSEQAVNAASHLCTASDKIESNNSINTSLLVRGVMEINQAKLIEGKLVGSISFESIDVSANRMLNLDNDLTVAGVALNDQVSYKDTATRIRIDAALHTKASQSLKVIYALGIASFSRDINVTQKDLGTVAGVAAVDNRSNAQGKLSSTGFPITVALEHQTWKNIATRFSVSQTMFSNGSFEAITSDYRDSNGDGINDTIDITAAQKDVIKPRTQTSTVGLGLGITPAEKVSFDIALQANIFDLNTAGNFITRASIKYHF